MMTCELKREQILNCCKNINVSLCPKSPSARGFVACLPDRLLFKSIENNTFYPVSSTQFTCRIATMTISGKMHCVIWRTGKHATKPRALGLSGHCGICLVKCKHSAWQEKTRRNFRIRSIDVYIFGQK